MLRLTVKDYKCYSEKPKENPKEQPKVTQTFEMREVKEMTYRGDKLKLWRLKDEVKTLNYLQQFCDPDTWIEYQNRIEELEFRITAIFFYQRVRPEGRKHNKRWEKSVLKFPKQSKLR